MKKIVILIGLCLVGFATMAQNVDEVNNAAYVSKRGVYLLPQAGDFALGIDASPFLRYLGNFFSNNGFEDAPNLWDQTTIYGKYFLEDNRAIRAKFSLGMFNEVNKGPGSNDVERISESNLGMGIGYEFRRGNGRVQGFFGGEALLGYGGGKRKFEYARMTEDDVDERLIEVKYGKTFSMGAGAFTGVEYFFAPQMSLGCELGLGLLFSATGKSKETYEYWDDDRSRTRTETAKTSSWDFNARTFNGGAIFRDNATYASVSIFLMFHF